MNVTAAQIPFGTGQIDTVEKLLVWCATALENAAIDEVYNELPNVPELVASANLYKVTSNIPFNYRMICRVAVPMASNVYASNKAWLAAQPITTGTIPVGWTA